MRWLYCNPADDGTRATELGCGWFPAVPSEFTNIAQAPCVILAGAGQQVVLADDGLTANQVQAAAQPLIDAETAPADDAPQTIAVQVDPAVIEALTEQTSRATTVAATRQAILALLNCLNPNT